MKRFLSLLATGLVALSMQAQFLSTPIEIWPNKVPDSLKPKAKHVWDTNAPDHIVEVTSPAIEVFHPKADNSNHQAIVVCPGGAYGILAYIHEGQEIAQWLTSLALGSPSGCFPRHSYGPQLWFPESWHHRILCGRQSFLSRCNPLGRNLLRPHRQDRSAEPASRLCYAYLSCIP